MIFFLRLRQPSYLADYQHSLQVYLRCYVLCFFAIISLLFILHHFVLGTRLRHPYRLFVNQQSARWQLLCKEHMRNKAICRADLELLLYMSGRSAQYMQLRFWVTGTRKTIWRIEPQPLSSTFFASMASPFLESRQLRNNMVRSMNLLSRVCNRKDRMNKVVGIWDELYVDQSWSIDQWLIGIEWSITSAVMTDD